MCVLIAPYCTLLHLIAPYCALLRLNAVIPDPDIIMWTATAPSMRPQYALIAPYCCLLRLIVAAQIQEGVNDSAVNLLAAIARGEEEVSTTTVFAVPRQLYVYIY